MPLMMNSQPRSQGFLQAFDEDYLSQGDHGKYLLKMATTRIMYRKVTRCLHYTLLMFTFCFKLV